MKTLIASVFLSPLTELSTGLMTFAQFGHKDITDAKVLFDGIFLLFDKLLYFFEIFFYQFCCKDPEWSGPSGSIHYWPACMFGVFYMWGITREILSNNSTSAEMPFISIKTVMNYLTLCFVALGNPHRSSPYQLQLRRTMCRAREWTVTISAAVTQASWQMRSSCLWTAWTVISQVWLTYPFFYSFIVLHAY